MSGPSTRGFTPGGCVRGVFRPGSSKSLVQRALLAASVARGETRLAGLTLDEDSRAALALVSDLALRCEQRGEELCVSGSPPGSTGPTSGRVLAVGESGTLARLATARVALASTPGARWTLRARGTLLFRRSRPLFEALAAAGVELALQNLPGTWPVELVAACPAARLVLRRPQSSQEVSALLLALAAHPEARELHVEGDVPSAPYLAMSVRLLTHFQARIEERAAPGGRTFRVQGPLVAPGETLVLEPDASSAAVVLAAACLSGGDVRVPGLGRRSWQGDVRVVEHLAAFGCAARQEEDALSARGAPTRAAERELSGEPDLAPVLAVVAAAAARAGHGASVLRGLATLPGKESDRLGGLATLLTRSGYAVELGPDHLRIAAGAPVRPDGPFDPRGDHRMAFAAALLGLFEPGVHTLSPECVAKSWSGFWDDLQRLGARCAEV